MQKNIIITNPERFEIVKKRIIEDGIDKFHVLSDFDSTLTSEFIEGKKNPSSFGQIRNRGHLGSEYIKRAEELFKLYYPIEMDPYMSPQEKSPKMEEWYRAHLGLLVEHGFCKDIIKDIVGAKCMRFRPGSSEFLDILHKKSIPLVIMSAGLGDIIKEYLEEEHRTHENIHIISNTFEFGRDGTAVKYNEPIIHSMNKHESDMEGRAVFDLIKERKNLLLLGDVVEDIAMLGTFSFENILKIGFLNHEIDKRLDSFKKNFDIIITDDGSMDFVNELCREII